MRNRLMSLTVALVAAQVCSLVTHAQAQAPETADSAAYDRGDLSGVWILSGGDRGVNALVPAMTAEGEARFNTNKPSYGRPLGSPLREGEHIGRARAVPPAIGNSMVGECNPLGVPRIYFDAEPWEFIQTPGRLLQFFSWTRPLREIWMDGRDIPEDWSFFAPTWYGYNVGSWDGDTFVVDSFGYDDRSWLDHFGYPHSEEMRIQERFQRVGPDTLELNMTINDPGTYTTPWVAQTKTFSRVPRESLNSNGWYGFLEELCIPVYELRFNERVRDPAGLTP